MSTKEALEIVPGICGSENCFEESQMTCEHCDVEFCDAHAMHPDHDSPDAG